MKSYDVKFWAIRPGKAKTKRTYEIRWKVGHVPHSRTLGNKAQAENFLSDLRHAARMGDAFDTVSGLPDSLVIVKRERSWFEFCLADTTTGSPMGARQQTLAGAVARAGRWRWFVRRVGRGAGIGGGSEADWIRTAG